MAADPASANPTIQWGTNRVGGLYYAGRVHIVWASQPSIALCGLPIDDVWNQRPATPARLCPECCLIAMAALFPTTQAVPFP